MQFFKRIVLFSAFLFSAYLILLQGNTQTLNTRPYQAKITLSQKEEIIAYPYDFAVLEDECFLINDMKDQKIMLYDRNGRYLKSWKTIGQGPGEYQGIRWNDYSKPYMGVFDPHVQKLILYRRVGLAEFQWIRDIFAASGYVQNFKIDKDKIVFDGAVFHKNRYYYIHILDLQGKKDEYCLPAAVRYGKAPSSDYKKPDSEFKILLGPPLSYIDVFDGYIYSAWKGMLNVIKVDMTTKKWTIFGHKTKNYSQPKVWKASLNDLKKMSRWKKKNKTKFSFVTGVFADRDMIGLIYLNYNQKKSRWEPILQLYNGDGIFLKEEQLAEAHAPYKTLKYYYSRDTGCLYVLNMTEFDSGEVEFEILKYQIRQ